MTLDEIRMMVLSVASGTLRMLEFEEGTFTRPLAIIHKRGRELSPAVHKFIELLTTSQALAPPLRGEKAERAAERDGGSRSERPEEAEKLA